MTAAEVSREMRIRGLTQWELALKTGMSLPWVNKVLLGQIVPSPKRKKQMESALAELLAIEPPVDHPERDTVLFEVPVLERAL
jgi:ribosome-binding protein aMBF1 (putative translation factor)